MFRALLSKTSSTTWRAPNTRALVARRGDSTYRPPEDLTVEQWIKKYMNDLRLDYSDKYCKHKQFLNFSADHRPKVQRSAIVAPSVTISGNVEVWDWSTIWNNVVLRGDINLIRIGAYTNIHDNVVIHEAFEPLSIEHDGSAIVGHYCSIGAGSMLRAVTIEDEVVVGANSILMDGCYIESGTVIGKGSRVPRGVRIPSGQLWAGNPVKYVRHLTDRERQWIIRSAVAHYSGVADDYKQMFFLDPHAYIEKVALGLDPLPAWMRHAPKQQAITVLQ